MDGEHAMDQVDVIVVMGSCAPERLAYAGRLAQESAATLLPAARLAGSPDPATEAATLAVWAGGAGGVVVELPDRVPAPEAIGAFTDEDARTRLLGVVTVVDAAHLLEDLNGDALVSLRDDDSGVASPQIARSLLHVLQIEYAATIALVNWSQLSTEALSTIMALLAALSPHARLRLEHAGTRRVEFGAPYTATQDRPGWICLLNDDFDPHMSDRRVCALRYEQIRPLHPGRLWAFLEEIAAGTFGQVVRSAGFFRLATRAGIVGEWEHAGGALALHPLMADAQLDADDKLLAIGQQLAFFGIDLDAPGLFAALDEAALTDAEFTRGAESWQTMTDPFPLWAHANDPTG